MPIHPVAFSAYSQLHQTKRFLNLFSICFVLLNVIDKLQYFSGGVGHGSSYIFGGHLDCGSFFAYWLLLVKKIIIMEMPHAQRVHLVLMLSTQHVSFCLC